MRQHTRATTPLEHKPYHVRFGVFVSHWTSVSRYYIELRSCCMTAPSPLRKPNRALKTKLTTIVQAPSLMA